MYSPFWRGAVKTLHLETIGGRCSDYEMRVDEAGEPMARSHTSGGGRSEAGDRDLEEMRRAFAASTSV